MLLASFAIVRRALLLTGTCPTSCSGKHRPSLKHLRAYGCPAFVLNLGPGVKKLDARSLKGRLVGYEADGQLYRVVLDGGRTVIVSKHVKLCEDGSSQLLREDMSELDKLMETAIQPSKPPKKSVRFCSEVMEHHIDEGPPASPSVSQPLRLGSGSVPALPVMQPTPHVSRASEFEPVVVPDVNVVDTSGEHSGCHISARGVI
jgi:hypothetical protein